MIAELSHDPLLRGRLHIWQPRRGARVTMDPLLLVDFARAQKRPVRGERVLDLGCGTGVMALALALDCGESFAVGVELVPEMAAIAARNAEENALVPRVSIVQGDLRNRHLVLPHPEFELIVSNPPYQPMGRGRVPTAIDRAAARAEVTCTLADVVDVARRKLSARGKLAMVLPAARTTECFAALAAAKLTPVALRAVHSVADEPARRVLIAAARMGELVVLRPLVIHGEDRRAFTDEARMILGEPLEG